MTEQSPQTLLSVLTAEPWSYDDDKRFISFKPGGTGELWAAVEFSLYLGASFDWEIPDLRSAHQPITTNKQDHLTTFPISITITNRPVTVFYMRDQRKVIPEDTLMDEAFQQKTFTVHLEKGIFPTPVCANNPKSFPYTRKYGLQLVFDESPFPPPEVWMPERRYSADSLMVWKWVRFGARDLGPWNTEWSERCAVM